MRPEALKARHGFVLLEAVVALSIIALFAVALLGAVGSQVRTADKANGLMIAQSLAEDRLASIRMLDYDGLASPPDSLEKGVFPPPFQDYSWTAVVTPVKDEFDLFQVDVTVSGRGDVFPLSTLVHQPNPLNMPQQVQGGRGGDDGGRGGRGGGARGGRGGRGGRGDDGGIGRGGRGGRGDGGVGRGGRGGRGGRAGGGRAGGGRAGGGRGGRGGGGGGIGGAR